MKTYVETVGRTNDMEISMETALLNLIDVQPLPLCGPAGKRAALFLRRVRDSGCALPCLHNGKHL